MRHMIESAKVPISASADFQTASIRSHEIKLQAQKLIARVVKLDETEGMLATHLSELLNISESGLRKHIHRHAIGAQSLVAHRMRSELGADVIPMFARSVLFIPKASIKQLVKVIDTPEAWAIYLELWEYPGRFVALEDERDALRIERDQLRAECDAMFRQRSEALAAAEAMTLKIGELTAANPDSQANAGKPKTVARVRRYRIEEIEFVDVNILHGPKYRSVTKRLQLDQMTREQREAHALQQGTLSACGFIKSAGQRMTSIGVQNRRLLSKREAWEQAGQEFLNELIPSALEFDGTFQ